MAESKGDFGGSWGNDAKAAAKLDSGEAKSNFAGGGGAKPGGSSKEDSAYDSAYTENYLEPADGKRHDVTKEAMALAKATPPPRPGAGFIGIAASPEAKQIGSGFKLNWMNMRDAYTGAMLWEQTTGWEDMYEQEIVAHVPSSILTCRAVSREVNFSSEAQLENFRLEQRVLLHEHPFEEWLFTFGFVMPGSTNTWQQVIEAASEMVPAAILNGNVVIETSFLDGDTLISRCRVRVFYDA